MANDPKMQPSTTDSGYILSMPRLENPYSSDSSYQRILKWYLPPDVLEIVEPRLTKFAEEAVSDQIHEWIANAEREQPYIKSRNVWGGRYPADRLVTSTGWKRLGRWGIKNGVVSLGYEEEFGRYRRIVQHAFNYTYSASSAAYSCPVSMTSGAGRLLAKHTPNLPAAHPFHEIYRRIIARQDNWISSQWMTERPGGSDVRHSETVAVYSPLPQKTGEYGTVDEGDYLISGFKFFASATDCDMCLVLAKTESGELSLFVAPVKINGHTNGIRFIRLKNKMGTKELPTAELELKDVRAWRIGPVNRGIATIALLLNVTRTHNFITALSCWRRGMAIAKAFAKARSTMNQPLWMIPMHLRLLASLEVKHRGALQLAFFTTALLSFADDGIPANRPIRYAPLPDPGEQATVVLRTLTATAKAVICKVGTLSLLECQEAMGGVGYMDEPDEPEYNIARLMRDTYANVTWEGTVNVLSSEVVRNLLRGNHLHLLGSWLETSIRSIEDPLMQGTLSNAWALLQGRMREGKENVALVLAEGRQLMFTLSWIMSGMLLAHDAQRDGDAVALEIARRWIIDGEGVGEFAMPDIVYESGQERVLDQAERSNWDCRLVWGTDLPEGAATGVRAETIASKL